MEKKTTYVIVLIMFTNGIKTTYTEKNRRLDLYDIRC